MKLTIFLKKIYLDNLLEIDDKCIIGITNNLSPYSMLIDAFKEMTIHLEGHCTTEEINEIILYLTNKVTNYEKKHEKH